MPKKIIKDPNFIKPLRGKDVETQNTFMPTDSTPVKTVRTTRGPVKQTEEAKAKISQKQKETIARKKNIQQLTSFLLSKIDVGDDDEKKQRYFTRQERAQIILNYLNKTVNI